MPAKDSGIYTKKFGALSSKNKKNVLASQLSAQKIRMVVINWLLLLRIFVLKSVASKAMAPDAAQDWLETEMEMDAALAPLQSAAHGHIQGRIFQKPKAPAP